MADDLEIHPLTPKRLPDLAALFGQGGDPKWCWCAYFRVRGMTWSNATPASNRAVLETAVRARNGHAPGLVAYRDGEAVGWVGLSPREEYERLEHSTVLAPVDARPVWSIVCFVVGRAARGQGVAAALLAAAVDLRARPRRHDARGVPRRHGGGRVPSANVYHGTLSMFERAGFRVVERRQFNRSSPVRPIVRRGLRPRKRA